MLVSDFVQIDRPFARCATSWWPRGRDWLGDSLVAAYEEASSSAFG